MEVADGANDIVHPEVRAHINSLVSALGGNSADDDGRYQLGDDAFEVLRDVKKWIRFYDEKTNRMDVARCLAEANLVGGDLLQILATWPENASGNRMKARIALACYEVMAPLTWPIEKDAETMTINHHRHMPVLQLAQLGYKKDIINYDGAAILHTAVRVALPSMAVPIGDRSLRDQGIIKLVLYFIRNIAMIAPPPGVKYDGDESQISRSATIDAFSYQDVFLALLTIASNMGEDFRTEDVIVMEIIFHLVKRVDIEKLFLSEKQLSKATSAELSAMMKKEAAMLDLTTEFHEAPPVWDHAVGHERDGKMSTLSGQAALADRATRERKMDNSKTFRPPRRSRKEEMEPKDLGPPVSLNARANDQLRGFVEEFLDSGFNPLFEHIRKTIDREAAHVLHCHRTQFFYLVAWFLEAERVRRRNQKGSKPSQEAEVSSFNLVAGVLNQEMFISLNRALDRAYNDKDWKELTAVMRCFTQILLTVQEMSESGNSDDEEIAENILNRLFYEESTHDAVANIVRSYKDQGFEYLDACTDLTHTYLRILEAYAKQNVDLQVRSRRRSRRKKKAAKDAGNDDGNREDVGDDSANDEEMAQKTTTERKFDFKRFANRFIPQGVVDTFVKFTRFYKDLDDAQLKRAHRYFYRVAFKQDMSVMLFRVDIIHLFYNMIKGPDALDKNSTTMFKEWEELAKQLIKKCVRKIEQRPALIIELLFSKINSTAHYLEYGYEKQTSTTHPRPGAELEFRHILERERQIAVAVGVLLDKNQQDHISWVKRQLAAAEGERQAWEAAERAMASVEGIDAEATENPTGESAKEPTVVTLRPDDDARRMAIFKNSHLRLLMKLVGLERLAASLEETPDSVWVVPSGLTAAQLKESLHLINKAEFDPPTFENDQSAEDQLRRRPVVRKKASYDDDDDGLIDEDGVLFPAGGPTTRKVADEFIDGKKKRRLRRKGSKEPEEPTEEELDERARARREKEREKARKIKSSVYVDPKDDEDFDDPEFFAREEAIRQSVNKAILGELATGPKPAPKRKSAALLDDSDEDIEDPDEDSAAATSRKRRKSATPLESDDEEEEGQDEIAAQDMAPSASKSKRRTRGGFVVSSDDEDEDGLTPSSEHSAARGATEDSDDAMETDDTPLSSSPRRADGKEAAAPSPLNTKTTALAGTANIEVDDDDDDDDDGPIAMPTKQRSRARAGFVLDSSDEE